MADEPAQGSGWTEPATKTISALQGTPMLLVLAVLNFLVLGMVTYLSIASAEHRAKERTELFETLNNCLEDLQRATQGP